MGFERWEVGFGKNMGWEMGLEPTLQDPQYRHTHKILHHERRENGKGKCKDNVAIILPKETIVSMKKQIEY